MDYSILIFLLLICFAIFYIAYSTFFLNKAFNLKETITNYENEDHLTKKEKNKILVTNYINKEFKRSSKSLNKINEDLRKTELLKNYISWNCSKVHSINQFSSLCLITIEQRVLEDEGFNTDFDDQVLLWLKLNESLGEFYLFKFDFLNKIYHYIFNKESYYKLSNYNVIGHKSNSVNIENILEILNTQKNLEIEISKSNLFIKTTKTFSIEEIKKLKILITMLTDYLK